MNNWFTVKVKYTKQLEELGQIIRGEFNVVGITRTEIHDIFAYDDVDLWYKVKIKYESADADSEKSKKVTQNFLVSANSVKEAYERIKESLSTLLVDFEIPSIMVSPIVEIFPYAENLDKEISRTPIEKVEVEEEEEDNSSKGGGVFSSSGSDVDDEDENSDEDEDESEIEDSTDED